jgi:hypothetical protein
MKKPINFVGICGSMTSRKRVRRSLCGYSKSFSYVASVTFGVIVLCASYAAHDEAGQHLTPASVHVSGYYRVDTTWMSTIADLLADVCMMRPTSLRAPFVCCLCWSASASL